MALEPASEGTVENVELWCAAQRARVVEYLSDQRVAHGGVGMWPAWLLEPYISVWAIESGVRSGWVGWWAISGDLPCDYVSADQVKHPRDALKVLGERWLREAGLIAGGQAGDVAIGPPEKRAELAPLLKSRAELMLGIVEDDEFWEEFERERGEPVDR